MPFQTAPSQPLRRSGRQPPGGPSRFRLALAHLIGSLLLFGCEADCEKLCGEMVEEDCYGHDGPDKDDCERLCRKDAELVEETDCGDEYDAYVACGSELEDICGLTPREECTTTISGGSTTTTCEPVAPEACGREWQRLSACVEVAQQAGPVTCATVSDAATCTNDSIPEIKLGVLSSSACAEQCETEMPQAGMARGCWIVAGDSNCYCRSGTLNQGGDSPGGSCAPTAG